MCFRPATKPIVAAALLSIALGGCSDSGLYLDRREQISLISGEAAAANRVTQVIDPWPKVSGNRNIEYDGERAAAAAQRYRTGRVIRPVSATTSSSAYGESKSADTPAAPQGAPGGGSNPVSGTPSK